MKAKLLCARCKALHEPKGFMCGASGQTTIIFKKHEFIYNIKTPNRSVPLAQWSVQFHSPGSDFQPN